MLFDEETLSKAKEILLNHALCDRCLGRLFASYGLGLSNALRGKSLKTVIAMETHKRIISGDEQALKDLERLALNGGDVFQELANQYVGKVKSKRCEICGNTLDGLLGELVLEALKKISGIEASTFIVGVKKSSKLELKEKQIALSYGITSWESIRREVKREVGKRIQALTGLRPDFKDPELIIIIDLDQNSVEIGTKPLYLSGSYVKLGRYITQMRWVGKEGRNYKFSVEESVRKIISAFRASEVVLHASGREDADARMLGSGRPVILELKRPLRRSVELRMVENSGSSPPWVLLKLRGFSASSEVRKLKSVTHKKIYRVVTYVEEGINENEISKITNTFRDIEVSQRTPLRVLRRRTDLIRIRKVYAVVGQQLSKEIAEFIIKCDGGLYVKELISGDNGRTNPSFSNLIGKKMSVLFLDVLKHEGMLE